MSDQNSTIISTGEIDNIISQVTNKKNFLTFIHDIYYILYKKNNCKILGDYNDSVKKEIVEFVELNSSFIKNFVKSFIVEFKNFKLSKCKKIIVFYDVIKFLKDEKIETISDLLKIGENWKDFSIEQLDYFKDHISEMFSKSPLKNFKPKTKSLESSKPKTKSLESSKPEETPDLSQDLTEKEKTLKSIILNSAKTLFSKKSEYSLNSILEVIKSFGESKIGIIFYTSGLSKALMLFLNSLLIAFLTGSLGYLTISIAFVTSGLGAFFYNKDISDIFYEILNMEEYEEETDENKKQKSKKPKAKNKKSKKSKKSEDKVKKSKKTKKKTKQAKNKE